MLEGHNHFPPMQPPRGQHYERWYHADGHGDELTALYNTRLPPLTDATQTWNSALPVAWHNSTWIGNRTIDFLREHRDRAFCLWASFPDPHHPFDARSPGAGCTTRTTSTCPSTARSTSSGGRGGIAPRSKACRR